MENKTIKILILFYSFTGKTAKLAEYIAQGAAKVADIDVTIKQIPEILPKNFYDDKPELKKIHDELDKKFPIATINDMIAADGVALGTPTHFGSFASQVKQYLDSLTPAWLKGKLINKPVAVFCSAGSTHGGEEITLFSLIAPLLNLGMIPVGIPYPIQGENPDFDAGSPYGAIYVTGGGRPLSAGDKKVAEILGIRLASIAHILHCGCQACIMCASMTEKIT